MGSHIALVKGNRKMGFQVDRATHRILVLVEGDQRRDLSLAQPHRCWFWLKGISVVISVQPNHTYFSSG